MSMYQTIRGKYMLHPEIKSRLKLIVLFPSSLYHLYYLIYEELYKLISLCGPLQVHSPFVTINSGNLFLIPGALS